MRVLITGGTGLIGRALTRALLAEGHEVWILSRNPEKYKATMPAATRLVAWDGRTPQGWGHLVADMDAVVNLAGESIAAGRWTEARKRRIRESRVAAGQALVAAFQSVSTRPRVLLQASAVGYYGPRGDEEVTEETPPGKDFLAQVAQEWEGSTAAVEGLGVRRVITRIGIVLSTEGGALPRLMRPIRLGLGGPLGSGLQWFPWVHILDVVHAMRFLMVTESARGPYNLTAPHPVRNAEFVRTLARILGRPAWFRVPAFALRLALGELADSLLTGQRAVPKRLLEAGYTFRFPTLEEALRDVLGRAAQA